MIRSSTFSLSLLHPLIAIAVCAQLTACSLFHGDEEPAAEEESSSDASDDTKQEAKELGVSAAPSSESPDPELVRTAKSLYQTGMYSLAREPLQTLHDRYPMGPYAVFAALKLADSYYYDRQYNEAAKQYEQFTKDYPGNKEVIYAKLQAARSYLGMSKGMGRDRAPLEKALQLYDSLVEQDPASSYGILAEKERKPVIERLADYDRMIIDFYAKRENTAAVEARRKIFEERWGVRLNPKTAKTTTAINRIPAPVPPSIEGSDAIETVSVPTGLAANITTVPASPHLIAASIIPVKDDQKKREKDAARIACREGAPSFALIQLASLPSGLTKGLAALTVEPEDDRVVLTDLPILAEDGVYSCFGKGDLQIQRGRLEVASERAVLISTLSNPPRLLLSPLEGSSSFW